VRLRVYVSCHPDTRIAHTRVIETRGEACAVRRHEVGLRLSLWELLPQPVQSAPVEWEQPDLWPARMSTTAR